MSHPITPFATIRRTNPAYNEFWSSRGFAKVPDYAIFQNHGYMGLYGGLGARDIHRRKGLKTSEQILDPMGSTELAANLFRATQAEEKLRREKITGKDKANKAHRDVGAKVRQTIKELGGTMPEELPSVESVNKLGALAKRDVQYSKPCSGPSAITAPPHDPIQSARLSVSAAARAATRRAQESQKRVREPATVDQTHRSLQ
jgi:hypothetical protein